MRRVGAVVGRERQCVQRRTRVEKWWRVREWLRRVESGRGVGEGEARVERRAVRVWWQVGLG